MSPIVVRDYRAQDAPTLRDVFVQAIRVTARAYYSEAQVRAWAAGEFDPVIWQARMDGIQPFVAEVDGRVAGYADVQADGYIDHFFVHPDFGGLGVGRALMEQILARARSQRLHSKVIHAARGFFEKFGFRVVRTDSAQLGDEELEYSVMELEAAPAERT